MRRSLHTEAEILHLLAEVAAGSSIQEICGAARVSERTFYRWRERYGGLTPDAVREMKELRLENRRLRSLLADLLGRQVGDTTPRQPQGAGSASRHDVGSRLRGPSASLGRFAGLRTH